MDMENKKINLLYFTGTGNSKRVFEIAKQIFEQTGYTVRLTSITDEIYYSNDKYEYYGFSFPVYSWGIPRGVRNFLRNLPKVQNNQKVFIMVTSGDKDEEGWALTEARKILIEKGYHVTNSDAVHMPNNWIVLSNPPSKDEAKLLLEKGERQAEEFTREVLLGAESNKEFIRPKS